MPTKEIDSENPSGVRMFGLSIAGVWLVLLIISSVFAAVLLFSATQFQLRFSNFSLNGGQLSIWKAQQMLTQWRISRDAASKPLEAANHALNESQQALTKSIYSKQLADSQTNESWQKSEQARSFLLERIQRIDNAFASSIANTTYFEIPEKIAPKLAELVAKDGVIASQYETFLIAKANWQRDFDTGRLRDDEIKKWKEVIEKNKEDIKLTEDTARLNIRSGDGKPVAEDQRVPIENAIYEFEAMSTVIFGWVYHLTLLPSDILVLWLVISMGLLGSSLQLTYVYITQFEQRQFSFYIIRPLFGIITAFVIFIVAKAGIPLFTDATRLGINAPINPYFISFLAIISGLLSERALVALLRVGSTYFREGEGQDTLRYARADLTETFKTAKRDPARLQKLLDAKDSEWNDWMKGKEPMPGRVQTVIAATLEMEGRDLFTDIPPTDAPGTTPDIIENSNNPPTTTQTNSAPNQE